MTRAHVGITSMRGHQVHRGGTGGWTRAGNAGSVVVSGASPGRLLDDRVYDGGTAVPSIPRLLRGLRLCHSIPPLLRSFTRYRLPPPLDESTT